MQHYRSGNPKMIHGTTAHKTVTTCGQRGRNVTSVWKDVTCQRCVEALKIRYGDRGYQFWSEQTAPKQASEAAPKCAKCGKDATDGYKLADGSACEDCFFNAVGMKDGDKNEVPDLELCPCATCGMEMVLGEGVNSILDPSKGVCPRCREDEQATINQWAEQANVPTDEYLRERELRAKYDRKMKEIEKEKKYALDRLATLYMQLQGLVEEVKRLHSLLTQPTPSFEDMTRAMEILKPKPVAPMPDLSVGLGDLGNFSMGSLISGEAARFKAGR